MNRKAIKNNDLDFKACKALVVEDNDFVRMTVSKNLQDFGFKDVFVADNGQDAIRMLGEKPDVIICDISMTPMNGYDFLKYLRELPSPQARTPCIFLTSHAEEQSVQKAVDLMVDAYLLKPVTPESLRKKVVAVMLKAREE